MSLKEDIEKLFALQKVDAAVRTIRIELGDLEKSADQARAEVAEKAAVTKTLEQEVAGLDQRRRELEMTLREEEQRTRNKRMRLQRLRTDKELSALRRELELGKESTSIIEEELLSLFEASEGKADELKRMQADLEAQETACRDLEHRLVERKRALQGELERSIEARAELAARLEPSLLSRYELIFDRKGGLAIVEIRDGCCGGCGIRLSPQLVTQLHRNTDLIHCQSCQRILVVPPPAPRPEVAAPARAGER